MPSMLHQLGGCQCRTIYLVTEIYSRSTVVSMATKIGEF